MAEVKVLIQGYNLINAGEEEKTCPTISLIKDGDIIMVADPGILEDQELLISALQKENINISDVNFVFITHSHIDHYRNIGMFPKAKTLEYFGIWDKNTIQDRKEQFSKDIKVIETPGHDKTSLTLLVNTDSGAVAICGDVFWKENGPEQDPYADNPEKLAESREKILKIADWIIPGHGPIYKNA